MYNDDFNRNMKNSIVSMIAVFAVILLFAAIVGSCEKKSSKGKNEAEEIAATTTVITTEVTTEKIIEEGMPEIESVSDVSSTAFPEEISEDDLSTYEIWLNEYMDKINIYYSFCSNEDYKASLEDKETLSNKIFEIYSDKYEGHFAVIHTDRMDVGNQNNPVVAYTMVLYFDNISPDIKYVNVDNELVEITDCKAFYQFVKTFDGKDECKFIRLA